MAGDRLHDETVERLAAQLGELFRPGGDFTVLSRVRCQLIDGFPSCLTDFDVAVVDANPCWLTTDDGHPVLPPRDAPRVAINIVSADTLARDTIATPNTLARSGVSEYVLFDPAGEHMRPVLQAITKSDDEMVRLWPAVHGVFFSGLDFRIDARGAELVVTKCGDGPMEEELFTLGWERDRLAPVDPKRAGLDARIVRLRERLNRPRTPRGGP